MDCPRDHTAGENDTKDVTVFQEFIDIKSQSVDSDTEDVEVLQEFLDSKSVRSVDSDVCPICFDSVQDDQVSAHV